VPAAVRHDLPAVPLTRADLPPGTTPRLGRLGWFTGARGRPFMTLDVRCKRCGRVHRHWWRGDWPVSAEVVSFQTTPCRKGPRRPFWAALDPALMGEHAGVMRQAREAFSSWPAREAARRAERRAATPIEAPTPTSETATTTEPAPVVAEPIPVVVEPTVPVSAPVPARVAETPTPVTAPDSPLARRVRGRLAGRE
jgi:hypothetical protein